MNQPGHLRLQGSALLPASVSARLKGTSTDITPEGAAAALEEKVAWMSAASTSISKSIAAGGPSLEAAGGDAATGAAGTRGVGVGVDNWGDTAAPGSFSRQLKQQADGAGPSSATQEQVSLRLSVSDGGMALFSALTPECEWQEGHAAVDVHVHGDLEAPVMEGSVDVSRATVYSPLLRYPITGLGASIKVGRTHQNNTS